MPKLKSLEILFDPLANWIDSNLADLTQLLGDGDFYRPQLQRLHLCGFSTTAGKLQSLFLRHSETLRDVSLRDAYFTAGECNDFFKAIAGRLPKLVRCNISGHFKATLGTQHSFLRRSRAFETYLIAGGERPRVRASRHRLEQLTGGILNDFADRESDTDEERVETHYLDEDGDEIFEGAEDYSDTEGSDIIDRFEILRRQCRRIWPDESEDEDLDDDESLDERGSEDQVQESDSVPSLLSSLP